MTGMFHRERRVSRSSEMPSAKYSCSGSPLRFSKGRTAIAGVQETGEFYYSAEITRLKGELLIAGNGKAADGETLFLKALETPQAQRAKSLELRAAVSLARFWDEQGRRAEARDLLAQIYGWFTEGFDTRDLVEARTLLDNLN